MLSPAEWHQRFKFQAGWTRSLRRYLLKEAIGTSPQYVLEIGCGSGAVLEELHLSGLLPAHSHIYGLDVRFDFLQLAQTQNAELICADAYLLPFPPGAFDLVFCHFLLLWLKNPPEALMEMKRVTQPGGWVVAMAEPDYAHRIDYPPSLTELGKLQRQSLIRQGANPDIGCRLAGLFLQAGFQNVKTGLLGGEWNAPQTDELWEAEWCILEKDLEELVPQEKLREYQKQDASARQKGERILFVPTFYALGQVVEENLFFFMS